MIGIQQNKIKKSITKDKKISLTEKLQWYQMLRSRDRGGLDYCVVERSSDCGL